MQLSDNGIQFIKNFEGVRLNSYKCSAGKWTVGVGHTGLVDGKKIDKTTTISKEKCDELFKEDIKVFEKYVNNTKLKLNQNQFDALVSFTFNLGPANLQLLIKNRTLSQIADAILLYNKASGKTVEGLVKRRKKERELFLTADKNISQNTQQNKYANKKLPYKVRTKCKLNIRKGPGTNYSIIRVADKNDILTVWAISHENNLTWGKNGSEWYCLNYCEEI